MNTALNYAVAFDPGPRGQFGMQGIVINSWNHIFGADASGAEESVGGVPSTIVPGVKWVAGKSSTGANPDGNVGVPVAEQNQARRGFIVGLTDGNYATKYAECPFAGERGQVKEMSGVDAGGQRSSASYSQGSLHMWTYDALALAITQPSWFDWRSSSVLTALERARRGAVHMRYAATVGYLNLAKANETNPSNIETWTVCGERREIRVECQLRPDLRRGDEVVPRQRHPLAAYGRSRAVGEPRGVLLLKVRPHVFFRTSSS